MHEQDKAIIQSLVSVAWADGKFEEPERQMLEGLLQAFEASEAEAAELRQYAATKRTLADVPLTELSHDDRRVLLRHAVLLTWVDGSQPESERLFLEELRKKLNVPEDEAKPLIEQATERAKGLLDLLSAEQA
jgi:tellurite resistance protein